MIQCKVLAGRSGWCTLLVQGGAEAWVVGVSLFILNCSLTVGALTMLIRSSRCLYLLSYGPHPGRKPTMYPLSSLFLLSLPLSPGNH